MPINLKFLFYSIFFILITVFSSCKFTKGNADKLLADTVIAKDTMVPLLIDLHLIEGIIKQQYSNNPNSNLYFRYYFEQVLKKYNTNTARFKSSIRYYTQHAATFDGIYEEVINKLNEIHKAKIETTNLQNNNTTSIDTAFTKPIGIPKIFDLLKGKQGN